MATAMQASAEGAILTPVTLILTCTLTLITGTQDLLKAEKQLVITHSISHAQFTSSTQLAISVLLCKLLVIVLVGIEWNARSVTIVTELNLVTNGWRTLLIIVAHLRRHVTYS